MRRWILVGLLLAVLVVQPPLVLGGVQHPGPPGNDAVFSAEIWPPDRSWRETSGEWAQVGEPRDGLVIQQQPPTGATQGRVFLPIVQRSWSPWELPLSVRGCLDFVTPVRQLAREVTDLDAPGPRGKPRLCLMYYPLEDSYLAAMVPVDSPEQFRAAKADALRRLTQDRYDLCRIGRWEGYGRPAPQLRPDDRTELSVTCQPRTVAADAGAEQWLDFTRAAVSRAVDLTSQQMDWRLNRSLIIFVVRSVDAGTVICQRYARPAGRCVEMVLVGRSITESLSLIGTLLIINLATQRDPEREISRIVPHEYTHAAQSGIGAATAFFPEWFIEGQAVYQEDRNGVRNNRFREFATRAQREGTALGLADITQWEDWLAHERREGEAAVYSRGFAAVAFLIERHGFDATVRLLRDNRNGSIDRFNELLATLTGMDINALDRALGEWLLSGAFLRSGSP